MAKSLPVIANLSTATFECSYGRGCPGLCCQQSEPPLFGDEEAALRRNLDRVLPHLRPLARDLIVASDFVSDELTECGEKKLRVEGTWCVFFNEGCVLQKIGVPPGEKKTIKPIACSLFPVDQNEAGEWIVRQKGYDNETWDLFCLDPKNSDKPAAQTLQYEFELAAQCDEEEAEERRKGAKSS